MKQSINEGYLDEGHEMYTCIMQSWKREHKGLKNLRSVKI
jgi:hypothetical protein